jgi:hypothetical protein
MGLTVMQPSIYGDTSFFIISTLLGLFCETQLGDVAKAIYPRQGFGLLPK